MSANTGRYVNFVDSRQQKTNLTEEGLVHASYRMQSDRERIIHWILYGQRTKVSMHYTLGLRHHLTSLSVQFNSDNRVALARSRVII